MVIKLKKEEACLTYKTTNSQTIKSTILAQLTKNGYITINTASNLLDVPQQTLDRWVKNSNLTRKNSLYLFTDLENLVIRRKQSNN